jgi:hypothetical protein
MMILTRTVISLRQNGIYNISAHKLAKEHCKLGYSLNEEEASDLLPDIIIDLDHERPDLFPFHLTNGNYSPNIVFDLPAKEWLVALIDCKNDENYLLAKSMLPWFIKSQGIRFAISRDFLSCVAHHLFGSSLYGRSKIYTEKTRFALQKKIWPDSVGAYLLGQPLAAIEKGIDGKNSWPKNLQGQAMDLKTDLRLLEVDLQRNFMSKDYRRKYRNDDPNQPGGTKGKSHDPNYNPGFKKGYGYKKK